MCHAPLIHRCSPLRVSQIQLGKEGSDIPLDIRAAQGAGAVCGVLPNLATGSGSKRAITASDFVVCEGKRASPPSREGR
eukprot:CAMPEP_0179894514 /NCGR_PEP_ID=MMETSP0982-20121206/35327_1 /TAXON_ID=483367 /ORGANISM="non described non described, Strain CCMP 2436" /LENGTH=78 /DNA_ID=CAMNT_0021791111 /DNA_START=411 /DNA_END=648 /DNA_ORIENTATION=+